MLYWWKSLLGQLVLWGFISNYTWPDFLLMSVMWLSKQVSFVQYSDNAKTEFKLNAYQDKGVAMSSLNYIRYRGGNTKTGSITHFMPQWQRQSAEQLQAFWHSFPLLSRSGAETHIWEGLFCWKRNEEECPQGGRSDHWRTLSGRGEEERCQATARR